MMINLSFPQILLLLGMAVVVIVAFQRLHIPVSLGYLLVGVVLAPHTAGPVIESEPVRTLAEFGAVFLLFTIGLNFSLPQIHALRRVVLRLGTAQVLLTLTLLFVSLLAAWATSSLGLSIAIGAFLAGMVLGETEFRHQVESTIRPFCDVLLGLFFIGIGMLFQPSVLPDIWLWALAGMASLLLIKIIIVAPWNPMLSTRTPPKLC
jgi:Kef-type K+ transport system membrane component KefB